MLNIDRAILLLGSAGFVAVPSFIFNASFSFSACDLGNIVIYGRRKLSENDDVVKCLKFGVVCVKIANPYKESDRRNPFHNAKLSYYFLKDEDTTIDSCLKEYDSIVMALKEYPEMNINIQTIDEILCYSWISGRSCKKIEHSPAANEYKMNTIGLLIVFYIEIRIFQRNRVARVFAMTRIEAAIEQLKAAGFDARALDDKIHVESVPFCARIEIFDPDADACSRLNPLHNAKVIIHENGNELLWSKPQSLPQFVCDLSARLGLHMTVSPRFVIIKDDARAW